MKGTMKNIHLEQDVIDELSIHAIKAGNKNFKNHVEFLLKQIALSDGFTINNPDGSKFVYVTKK